MAKSLSRPLGLLVIGLVLLTAVVVPGVVRPSLPGAARPVPLSGPPAVGDCVTQPIDPTSLGLQLSAVGSVGAVGDGGPTSVYSYPQVALQPCTGERFGEVTMVIAHPVTPVTRDGGDNLPVSDPNLSVCNLAALRYAGLQTDDIGATPLEGLWYPTQQARASAAEPSPRQLAAGQHWLACIVYRGASVGDSTPYADQERYIGSLRDGVRGGPGKDVFSTCVAHTDLYDPLVPCSQPHHSEVFADATAPAPLSQTAATAGCQATITSMTGLPLSRGADLKVAVQAVDAEGRTVSGAPIVAGTFLLCGLTAQRELGASLLGVGTGEIPWR